MKVKFLFGASALILAACAQTPAPSQKVANIDVFAELLERTFETSPDNTKNNICDKRLRVRADALDGYWFYTQLNTGAERKLYRQRLSHLRLSDDGTAIIQTAYGFKTPKDYVDAWETPDKLASLTRDDFEPYFQKGCEQVWRPNSQGAWTGYVDPQTCVITSKRRDKDIRIESEGYLSKDIYRTNERGYEMDMTFMWGTKPGEFIDLYPLP